MVWLPDGEKNSNICLFVLTSSTNMKKSPFSRTTAHIFCFPWKRPCDYHAICCMDGKAIQCLPKPSQHVSIYLQQFPSYTMLKSMCKSKNRYFYHIFVSPGDAPGAITLCCMDEKRMHCLQLSRSMYPSIFNSFPVIRTASAKNHRLHVPQPTFLFPVETPLRLSRSMLHRWKAIQCLANPSQHVPIYLQ